MNQPIVPLRRSPLVGLLIPVAIGIVLDRYLSIGMGTWCAWCGGSLAAWWVVETFFLRRLGIVSAAGVLSAQRDQTGGTHESLMHWCAQRGVVLILLASVVGLAGAWHHVHWNLYPKDEIGLCVGEVATPALVKVQTLEFPRLLKRWEQDSLEMLRVEDQTICRVRVLAIRDGDRWVEKSGRMDIRLTGQLLDVRPGDALEVFGSIRRPGEAMNPGGLAYDEFERSERRLAMLRVNYPHAVTVVDRGVSWSPRWWAAYTREWGRQTLRTYLSRETFPLGVAILMGDRDQLSRERADVFLHTGTVHLLAISGLHLAILAGTVLFFLLRLGFLPTRVALWLMIVLTIGYAIFSGGRAPVVRAAILIVVFCFGRLQSRENLGMNSLAGAALIILGLNPCQLFRTGAQLSFLAVAGMIWVLPYLTYRPEPTPLQRLVMRYRSWPEVMLRVAVRWVWRMVLATLVIWFVSLPLVMNRFHLVAPSGLLLNLFVWVPLAIALFCGFGVLLTGWLFPPGARWLAGICDWALNWMEAIPAWAEPVSGSHFWVPGPSDLVVGLFYSLLVLGLLICRGRRSWMVGPGIAFSVLAMACFGGIERREADALQTQPMHCAFLSVGHGACAAIEMPTGELWLIDAGSLSSSRTSVAKISNYLWSRGYSKIDTLVLSHADLDHYNAAPGLIDRFEVRRVLVSPVMFHKDSRALARLKHCFEVAQIPIGELVAGRVFEVSPARIEVLHPAKDWLQADDGERTDNVNSLVLKVDVHDKCILLAGDVEGEGLDWLLANVKVDADIALAPHHGSPGARPAEFCEWATPEHVVVSAGIRTVGSVGPRAYEEAGAKVLHTAESGAVEFVVGPEGIEVEEFRRDGNPKRERGM